MIVSLVCFRWFLLIMTIIAIAVFIALFFVNAGYGMMSSKGWGHTISNKWAWMLMEAPVFIVMCLFWILSPRRFWPAPLAFFMLFQMHYLQRSFIFPWLMKGKSKMPLSIMFMGIFFNLLNGCMQGEWIFFLAPDNMYTSRWLLTTQFILGSILFLAGFVMNLHSDYTIRHLRTPGDTKHYFPTRGMFRYVTCAHYLGELTEWLGFAILTWSASGAVFFIWTFANLVPRSNAIYHKYWHEFPKQMAKVRPKRIFPFIY